MKLPISGERLTERCYIAYIRACCGCALGMSCANLHGVTTSIPGPDRELVFPHLVRVLGQAGDNEKDCHRASWKLSSRDLVGRKSLQTGSRTIWASLRD